MSWSVPPPHTELLLSYLPVCDLFDPCPASCARTSLPCSALGNRPLPQAQHQGFEASVLIADWS